MTLDLEEIKVLLKGRDKELQLAQEKAKKFEKKYAKAVSEKNK